MRVLATVMSIDWIIFIIYWIISARGTGKSLPYNPKQFFGIRLFMIILAIALLFVLHVLPKSIRSHALGSTHTSTLVIGFIVFWLGFMFAVWARITIGKNWGMPMTKKQDTHLVTTGPYKYVRHPIYSGMLLMMIGSALVINIYWLMVLIVASVFFIYSARMEEKQLSKLFPSDYPKYRSHSKMLIPFVF